MLGPCWNHAGTCPLSNQRELKLNLSTTGHGITCHRLIGGEHRKWLEKTCFATSGSLNTQSTLQKNLIKRIFSAKQFTLPLHTSTRDAVLSLFIFTQQISFPQPRRYSTGRSTAWPQQETEQGDEEQIAPRPDGPLRFSLS